MAAEGLRAARDGGSGVGGAHRRPAHRRGRVRVREVRPGRPAAPTTSTSGPGRSPREEADFLAASVAGVTDVTYADVENAPAVVLVGLEPEEECPILFLRLRKAYLKKKLHGVRGRAVRHPRPREARRRRWSGPCRATRPSVLAEHADGGRGAERAGRDPDRRRAAGRACRVGSPPRRRWPRRPAPSWPGCRGAPVTAARSTPAACPTCCPAAVRSPTPAARAELGAGVGPRGRARMPERARPGHRRILAAAADGTARRAGGGRRRPGRPGRPAAGRAGAGRGAVPGQPGAARAAR